MDMNMIKWKIDAWTSEWSYLIEWLNQSPGEWKKNKLQKSLKACP